MVPAHALWTFLTRPMSSQYLDFPQPQVELRLLGWLGRGASISACGPASVQTCFIVSTHATAVQSSYSPSSVSVSVSKLATQRDRGLSCKVCQDTATDVYANTRTADKQSSYISQIE
jgi:hypothetical protein